MKLIFTPILLFLIIACTYKEQVVIDKSDSKTIKDLYISAALVTEGVQQEFLFFDGKGFVYYLMDTVHSKNLEIKRVLDYATRATVLFGKDSIIFRLDSFYIGKGTFSAVVFNNKKVNGEEKIYYHNLTAKYSGISRNDTLRFSVISVSMGKDTMRSNPTYVRVQ